MALEHKVKTTNLLNDIEEELFKSLKVKISFDNKDKEKEEETHNKEEVSKE